MEKYALTPELVAFEGSLKSTVQKYFKQHHVLIFIGACGIAVRSIAPFIEKKDKDPCVLSIDEKGQYVISLLSGHIGGGNHFTQVVANAIDAVPIISTATDLNDRFAIDVFAKQHHLALSNIGIAKAISAALLDGEQVGISGIIPNGSLPRGLEIYDPLSSSLAPTDLKFGFTISSFYNEKPFTNTLYLIPKNIVLGIGCKKNTSPRQLTTFIRNKLAEFSIFPEAITAITSIDLKKDEPAITQLARHMNVPFITYTTDELLATPGNFTSSDFVKSIVGVDNVCERSALRYKEGSTLYLRKIAENGMTLAIALLPPVPCTF